MYKKSSGASSFSVTHIFQTNITNPTPPVTMVSSQPHTKDFLIQCQAQNNTFQCSLDQNFRDLECQQKDLSLQYVTSSISSPKLGNYTVLSAPRTTPHLTQESGILFSQVKDALPEATLF